MAYQTIPPGTANDWRSRVLGRVKALDPTLTRMPLSSDCVNIGIDMVFGSATGTGAANALATLKGGGMELTSGGTAGGIRVAQLGNSGTPRQVINARTDHYAIYCRAKIVTAPASGTERLVVCCVQDGTNDVGLGLLFSASATNWCLVNTGIATAGVDTTVAFDTNFHELLMWNDGTNIRLYIDFAQAGTAYTSATYIASADGYTRTYAYNAAVNGTVNHYMDRWALFTVDPA